MDGNPYAPPTAAVADLAPVGLERRGILVMIALTLVTLGLYYPIWFLRRLDALNDLHSRMKLPRWPFVVALAAFVVELIVDVADGLGGGSLIGRGPATFLTVVRLAFSLLLLLHCYLVKDILEDHLATFGKSVKLSRAMIFFFQIYYLQYVINRDVVGSSATAA